MSTQRVPWFERKFRFDLQAESWDDLLESLRSAPARLEALIAGAPARELTRRSGDDWSIQEHAGHLWDLEDLHRRRLLDYAAGAAELRPAELSNRRTHEAHHNDDDIASLLADFRFERELFVEKLSHLTEVERARTARHPRLEQAMRVVDLMRFVVEHDNHHLERIRDLTERFGA